VDDKSALLEVWDRATTRFDNDDSLRAQHKAWLRLTRPLGLVHDTAVLAAPNEYIREHLDANLRSYLATTLSTELGTDVQVAVTVATTDDAPTDDADADDRDPAEPGVVTPIAAEQPDDEGPDWTMRRTEHSNGRHAARVVERNLEKDARDARLNPRYTFDTFVIGSSNRFTHAAAVAVAEAPARAYNPFFIYGDSGLGKTHLLHAIGHYAQSLMPGLRTRYVSSEEFTNDFINSVRDDKMQAFQSRYRSVDLLLIDDIQFIERAERTQEEFFHTFNTLHSTNKQIVISSDKPPRQLKSLEDRLRTRFESGLISDVQTPDLETRIAILRKKASQEGMNLPPEVLEFIATRIESNIRELEGALIRVTAFASLNRQMVDMKLTESVLKDLVGDSEAPEISANTIMAVVADFFGITVDDLVGPSRSRALVHARQIAMYLCRELTDLSLPRIGEKFGGRDHTTVMHGERQIKTQMAEKRTTYNQISELTSRIKVRSRN
jgi:chromosomal replication initiator protein